MSNAITSTWPSRYGFSAIFAYDFESVDMCYWNDLDQFDDADLTEGMIAAFLQDVADGANEEDPNGLPGGLDAIDWSPQRLLQTQGIEDPTHVARRSSPALRARYPESSDAIWMAATNSRFEMASTTPRPRRVTGLTSTSHVTSGDSPDGTVDLVWNASSDNYSGVGGYSVRVSANSPPDSRHDHRDRDQQLDLQRPGAGGVLVPGPGRRPRRQWRRVRHVRSGDHPRLDPGRRRG